MIINNSLSVTLLTKMHEIACLYNFKNFRESICTDPLRLASFGRIVSPLNLYAACYFSFDAYKNFFLRTVISYRGDTNKDAAPQSTP